MLNGVYETVFVGLLIYIIQVITCIFSFKIYESAVCKSYEQFPAELIQERKS